MFKKRVSLFTCILITLLAVAVTFVAVTSIRSTKEAEREAELRKQYMQYESVKEFISSLGEDANKVIKLTAMIDLIESNFIYDYNGEDGWEYAYKAFVQSLGDQHSYYMTADEYTSLLDDSKGNFVGIGVHATFDQTTGGIYIFGVIPGSPAERADMRKGDIIVKVGDLVANGDNYYTVIDAIAGESGTEVKLTVLRDGTEIEMSIVRGSVGSENVIYTKLDGDIAYFRILSFSDTTLAAQFATALARSKADGCKAYIFDVRNNTGGYLDQICEVLDTLLPEGPIIHTVYNGGQTDTIDSDADFLDAPMAVLANGITASAAELFTAALRDYDMADIVGETTFGKGTMQTIRPLGDGSAIRLSYATYNPPSNVSYDKLGITPDYAVELPAEWKNAFFQMPISEDTQLQKALSLVSAKIAD